MAAQTGFYDPLKSIAGKVFSYLASITLTGTDGKTLTVQQDTTLDEAVSMSSKAPKAGPVFTGDVKGTSAAAKFTNINPTNAAVQHVGGNSYSNMLDNQSFTITIDLVAIIIATDTASGKAGAFFACYASDTIVELGDPSAYWAVTDSDLNPGFAIFKSANSPVITIKNYSNATHDVQVNVFGFVVSATAAV